MAPKQTIGERAVLGDITNEHLQAVHDFGRTSNVDKYIEKTNKLVPVSMSQSPPPAPATGTKRKSTGCGSPDVDLSDIDVEGMTIDKSCNQIRGQIRRFLESGEMKVGEFCDAIGVSNKSLNDFLRQNGTMKGSGSSSYYNAWEFFKRREIARVKMPSKKKAKTTGTGGDAGTKAAATTDISRVHLDGEEEGAVEVFDSCDEIRRKINAHLKKDGVTQAQFCRDLSSQLHGSGNVATAQLTSFRGKKGANAGATSNVFYAAYVYFEKVRLASKKPKSKHRLEMEDAWPNGFDLEHDSNTRYICSAGSRPHVDRLGKIAF